MLRISVVILVCAVFASSYAQTSQPSTGQQATFGGSFDDIVVESSLNVRKKPTPLRQTREIVLVEPLPLVLRTKRQFNRRPGGRPGIGGSPGFGGNPNFGGSSATANANANNYNFGPNGFGASAANAGAQSFQSQGPLGGFGASASNAQSQGFQVGPNGITGNAGLSGGQTYNLPNGQTLSLTYANGVSFGPDGKPTVTRGNSIGFSQG